ncbi:MAG: hypothetical protein Unbinned834contig1000_47 [Prokaryotic dsDNA virus sp.]|nr:MAG: hypothetical protein Unbinned834contig1000_47 [Prokaryotic dsDNA virus sp.]|tara:strand:+ start:30888 stop:31238 length:351 start_codon:yes stop_codon:yes gene_type:complete
MEFEKLQVIMKDVLLNGMSYADVARRMNCSRQYIQNICNSKTPQNQVIRGELSKLFLNSKDRLPDFEKCRLGRRIANKSQLEVAKAVGTTQPYIHYLENNDVKSKMYSQILKYLDI